MTKQQYKQFKKLAKKHKLLYSVIRDKDDRGQLMDVILPVTELDRANAIFERILYTLPPEPERKPARELQQGREVFQPDRSAPERQAPEQVQARRKGRKAPEQEPEKKAVSAPEKGRQRQVKLQPEVSQRSAEQGRQEAPVTQRQENKGKNGSRSERDSHAIKISASIPKESGATRGTSERPSIEARLQGYRAQQRKAPVPAKEITKAKAKVKPQAKAR